MTRRPVRWGHALGAGFVMLPTAIANAAPGSLDVRPNTIVAGTIAGSPARIRVAADAPDLPILDPAYVARNSLSKGLFQVGARVGPVRLTGRTMVTRVDLGDGPSRQRVMWFDRAYATGGDAVVGPGGMPQAVLRFVLRPAVPGEHASALPLVDFGHGGMGTVVRIGTQRLKILFALDRADTLANAPAATLLAAAQDGRFNGPAAHAPIRFGIADRSVPCV